MRQGLNWSFFGCELPWSGAWLATAAKGGELREGAAAGSFKRTLAGDCILQSNAACFPSRHGDRCWSPNMTALLARDRLGETAITASSLQASCAVCRAQRSASISAWAEALYALWRSRTCGDGGAVAVRGAGPVWPRRRNTNCDPGCVRAARLLGGTRRRAKNDR